jgi:hypothetical protein
MNNAERFHAFSAHEAPVDVLMNITHKQ